MSKLATDFVPRKPLGAVPTLATDFVPRKPLGAMPTLAWACAEDYTSTMLTNRRKHCRRYDVAGDAHCLTFSCYQRLPLLSKPRSCGWMLEALRRGRERGQYDLWAYVIMPEHAHVVLWPHPGVKISQILTTLKQSVSKKALLWLHEHSTGFLAKLKDGRPSGKRAYRFWQRGGGYDRNLRTVADLHEKIAYVHNNPVRRGLVATPDVWPWSSCRSWQLGIDEPIPIDRDTVPRLSPIE